MRNLKKLLALVLAMVMAFSLMLSAGAVDYKDYPDKDNITEEFKEAVQVLTGLKVFQGDEGGFRPGDTITRAEVAAIIYRIATGDVEGKQVKIYADYGNFTDVPRDEWFAGYVGYCANAEYIKGTSPTTFEPYASVTGYQALAMILRVVGYDKNGEFTGPSWQTNVASLSKNLGITDNVKNANFETTLTMSARRDVVADLLFQTAVLVPTVTYTPALQYSDKISITETKKNPTLGQKTFGLFVDPTGWREVDEWGTPGYYWVKGGSHLKDSQGNARYNTTTWLPVYGATVVTDAKAKGYNVVATVTPAPTVSYDAAGVHECDVAHDLDISKSENFKLYVNRNTPITTAYNIVAIDTVTRVGGQGRETKFWYKVESPFVGKMEPWCTMVDTYLATVTNVTERVLDPAGHVIVPSYLYLDVYDGQAVGVSDKTDAYEPTTATDTVTRNTSEHRAEKSSENWTYAKGDKVLIKGWTDYTQNDAYQKVNNAAGTTPSDANIDNGSGLNHLFNNSVEAANKAAFETNRLQPAGVNYAADKDNHITVVQKTDPVLGKQTVTYWNQGKHTVDGKDYNDQMTLFLDVAGTKTNTTFAWYFDTKGNLIGIDYVPDTVNYGVITSIWTSFGQGESDTDGNAKTYAKVLYADGKEATITIDRFLTTNTANTAVNAGGHVAPTTAGTAGAALDITATTTGNTAELIPAYDYNAGNANTMSGAARNGTAKDASQPGYLHVAPVASINDAQDANTGTGKFGIIKDNLFKFEASADGKTTVVEVAGDGVNAGKFVGHYYTINDDNSAANKTGKLFKNLGCMSVDGGANAFAWLNADTRIMLNDGSDDEKVSCYTLSTLPGDITIAPNSEIDWADTNNDGRVDVVYLTGDIEGTTTYNLFYYNGGAAQWNGVDKKGTLFGWLNGEPTTITFDDEAELNAVKNSQGYKGHLFALQMTNSVVSNVMGVNQTGANDPDVYLLVPTAGTAITVGTDVGTTDSSMDYDSGATGIDFKVGKADGNPYTATTEAVYIEDVAPNSTTQSVSYDPNTRTIIVWTDDGTTDGIMQAGEIDATYYLVPNSKVIGLGMSVNQESAILDYLNKSVHNDVTIVYEITGGAMMSIVEIYVATDPNVTPGGEVTVDAGIPGYGVTALTNISSGISDADLTAAIKGVGPNSVVYSPYAKTNAAGVSDADEFLYFPFVGETGNTAGAALTIYKNGVPVFQENETNAVAGAKYFVINFASGTSSNTTISSGPLTAGTYTFKIVSNGTGATLSSGTFVMN